MRPSLRSRSSVNTRTETAMRRTALAALLAGGLLLAACVDDDDDEASSDTTAAVGSDTTGSETTSGAGGGGDAATCAEGKTLEEGTLTIATGEPAFPPYVIDDAPENKQGFEAAVAWAVAAEMGFGDDSVVWVRTTFEQAIQPGTKDFDFNLQQYSITDDRAEVVSFSDPYYTTNQAIVALDGSPAEGATSLDDLKDVRFGVQAGTTSLEFATEVIQPDSEVQVYNDNAAAKAALEADQIDAIVADLPTALYISAVEIEGSSVVGQFPPAAGVEPDSLGMVFEKDNPLVECVNLALTALRESGELEDITNEWMVTEDVAPVIETS
jgi:polar amino acid transport system substrate-binding protein